MEDALSGRDGGTALTAAVSCVRPFRLPGAALARTALYPPEKPRTCPQGLSPDRHHTSSFYDPRSPAEDSTWPNVDWARYEDRRRRADVRVGRTWTDARLGRR